MSRSTPTLALAIALLAALPVARAEIYTWTDADGHVHYTQDLQSVPPDQRGAARERAAESEAAPSRVQGFESAPAAPAPGRARRAFAGRGGEARRVHRIPVERAGNGMVVPVRINGRVVAPFLVDTGASYVLVPQAVAEEAGLHVGPDSRKMAFSTANGVVEQAVVMLDSVELGTAAAEDVPASISPSLPVGLLGLSFFNRFTYQVDAANGVLTLVENDLAASGDLRGGRSESQWRGEFEALRQRTAALEARREQTPSSRSRLLAALDEEERVLERELDLLEAEADQAQVPDAWRR
jgi:clan AA aspartic protease (TIGR02281 family)